jgi:hypothetical protein
MRKIWDIYDEYKIMPRLREHQLRVAAVASLICDNFTEPLDKENLVTACLLHDMGNIIKFKLDYFPEFTKPEGLDHWQKIKDEYIKKYGENEYVAVFKIVAEVGVNERLVELIKAISFLGAPSLVSDTDFCKKIVEYCDDRVGPFGVISLEQRFADLRKRYADRDQDRGNVARDNFENALRQLEKQIFAKCKIKPSDTNDETIKPIFLELKEFVVK